MLEKENGFLPYKYRDLKIYGSLEWLADGKKKYRRVFDRAETNHIYCELSFFNKLFDREDWEINVTLKAYALETDGSRLRRMLFPAINPNHRDIGQSMDDHVGCGEGHVAISQYDSAIPTQPSSQDYQVLWEIDPALQAHFQFFADIYERNQQINPKSDFCQPWRVKC